MTREKRTPDPIAFEGMHDMPFSTVSMGTMEWNRTGSWRYMRPRYTELVPACQFACPTGNDIEAWIRLMEKGELAAAWEAATLENPFPGIMGRICFHPCTRGCNRQELGGAVNIPLLERALADRMGEELPAPAPLFEKSGKRIAVVGSGPAGLACAYHAQRLGHAVTVFEKEREAGGMLRYGIPAYRLPKGVVDREIRRLEKMGVQFELGRGVQDATKMQALRQDFDAVFLAPGAWKSRALSIPGEKSPGVMPALDFLKRVAARQSVASAKNVLVVGGGNSAVDAARTARRLGAAVTLLYRRTKAEMPAFEEEVRAAEEEGVRVETLLAPTEVTISNGRAAGLVCQKMQLGAPDKSGRRRPEPVADAEPIAFAGELILTAIGEGIDTTIIPSALPIEKDAIKTAEGGRTEWTNVFAGGDFAGEARTVVDALGSGKRSAIAIDCLLRGEHFDRVLEAICLDDADPAAADAGRDTALMARYRQWRTGEAPPTATASETTHVNRVVRFEDLNPVYFTASEPTPTPALAAAERLAADPHTEVHPRAADEAIAREIERCFHCGRCTECDNCFIYCPDIAIAKQAGGFAFDLDYCKGCGLCRTECPRAAIEMIPEPMELE